MTSEKAFRSILLLLGFLFFVLYFASKIHFFSQYDPSHPGDYIEVHEKYWIAMAAAAFLIWAVTKLRSRKRP